MVHHEHIVNAFGISQGIILAVIVGTIFLVRRRERERTEDINAQITLANLRASIQRTAAFTPEKKEANGAPVAAPLEVESALPTWTADTPPHVVLGVHPAADAQTVEAAYKTLLKKYHPDRFASWGEGYQKRAHHVVILLQKARDRMLAG